MTGGAFSVMRPDGWPLCPQCGEDELYSLANPATVETIVGCYRCSWPRSDSEVEADRAVIREARRQVAAMPQYVRDAYERESERFREIGEVARHGR